MIKSLWIKFLLLLIIVSLVMLSSSFLIRQLMVQDFNEYIEGETEDRIYWITAAIEGSYKKHSGWEREPLVENTLWALMLGFKIRVLDVTGDVIIDTEKAIDSAPLPVKKRVLSVSRYLPNGRDAVFIPYALFLEGTQIGAVEVSELPPPKQAIYIQRSNRFLLISVLISSGLAIILSMILSKSLTVPIKRLTAAALSISSGDLKTRVSITGNDEIAQLSDTFNKMAHALEIQERIRKRLTSNVAHELRTPLSAIRGELEGMIDGLFPSDKGHLESLYAETGRLKNILDGIEDLSRTEAQCLMIEKIQIELGPFLQNIVDRFLKLYIDKGAALELHVDEGLIVKASPDSIAQIIINLLSNALKASEEGGRVIVNAFKKASEIIIEVVDSGCGIKKDELPLVFERFYKTMDGGLGLGLAISKEIAEAHGGKITAESDYGKGSIFRLIL
ncbi:MAG: ATP-binding protein, partial [Nitrospirae bacterium]|nr:ATP-binding protein [Nitrospirota bacterium]